MNVSIEIFRFCFIQDLSQFFFPLRTKFLTGFKYSSADMSISIFPLTAILYFSDLWALMWFDFIYILMILRGVLFFFNGLSHLMNVAIGNIKSEL